MSYEITVDAVMFAAWVASVALMGVTFLQHRRKRQ
jgi:hypothetical protein